MKIVSADFEILGKVDGMEILKSIERAGRVCYKSEDKITDISAARFVKNIIKRGHESVLEHQSISILLTCDRGVSHEVVRHRIAAYSQESTRYCNYGGEGITVIDIRDYFMNSNSFDIWLAAMINCEKAYMDLLKNGESPQIARSVLPNSLKTEIVITYNMREWRHFLKLRTTAAAQPQMREIALLILHTFKETIPIIFDDIRLARYYLRRGLSIKK
jgi:thymidylate synthase (FAD)